MGLFSAKSKPARLSDGSLLDLGGLKVRLRVSARARRVSLRVDRASGEAIAVAPSRSSLNAAARFAEERRAWLLARLSELPTASQPLLAGGTLEVLGESWRLQADGRRPRLAPSGAPGIRLARRCGEVEVDPMLVSRLVRAQARATFTERVRLYCDRLGVPAPRLSLMDARTRWGSCTPAQRGRPASIRLSWRLALAPFEVADYVVAHECAHLIEANHSAAFWAVVRDLVGDPATHRSWLRQHGPCLHTRFLSGAGAGAQT